MGHWNRNTLCCIKNPKLCSQALLHSHRSALSLPIRFRSSLIPKRYHLTKPAITTFTTFTTSTTMTDKLYIDETPDEVKNAKVRSQTSLLFPSLPSLPFPQTKTQ
jgi:hypothetical protein